MRDDDGLVSPLIELSEQLLGCLRALHAVGGKPAHRDTFDSGIRNPLDRIKKLVAKGLALGRTDEAVAVLRWIPPTVFSTDPLSTV